MKDRIVIEICMGSSCFSRGNRKTLSVIQNYLREHEREQDIVLKGNHCFSDCSKGPVVKINGEIHEKVTPQNIIDILEKTFA